MQKLPMYYGHGIVKLTKTKCSRSGLRITTHYNHIHYLVISHSLEFIATKMQ